MYSNCSKPISLFDRAIAHLKAESLNSISSDGSEHSRVNDSTENSDEAERIKSAISIVQEVAQKRELPIRFAVKSENGPAHMKHFVIICSVGEITVSIFIIRFTRSIKRE